GAQRYFRRNTSHYTQRTLNKIPSCVTTYFKKKPLANVRRGHSGILNSLPALSIIYPFAHNAWNTTLPYKDGPFWKTTGIFSYLFPMISIPFSMSPCSVLRHN